jgi:hypothetical protein
MDDISRSGQDGTGIETAIGMGDHALHFAHGKRA